MAKAAPKMKSGDSIELAPLAGKVIAVCASHRYNVETKFGTRSISQVRLLVESNAKPLEGVLFQSYFQGLDIGEWYIGRVVKEKTGRGEAWGLVAKGIDKKLLAKIEQNIVALPAEESDGF